MKKPNVSGDISDVYKVLVSYQTHSDSREKIKIGTIKKCRFCLKKDSKYFKNVAHTLPEFLRNKTITSEDECDHCNQIFSKYENELAIFLRPYLTMGQIKGKRGVPKLKGKGFELNREIDKKICVSIYDRELQDVIQFNSDTNSLVLSTPLPELMFVPRHAYKALCKMGLSILPNKYLRHFQKLREWILNPDDTEDFQYLECGISHTDFHSHFPYIGAYILERKSSKVEVPFMIFILIASTFSLKIDLMSDNMDNHIDLMEIGKINISRNTVIGTGEDTVNINYDNEISMNWASSEKSAIPLKALNLNISLDRSF